MKANDDDDFSSKLGEVSGESSNPHTNIDQNKNVMPKEPKKGKNVQKIGLRVLLKMKIVADLPMEIFNNFEKF